MLDHAGRSLVTILLFFGTLTGRAELFILLPNYIVCTICYSKCITRKFLTLKNESQGHTVHHSQWSHSIANTNLYKQSSLNIFCYQSPFSRNSQLKIRNLENVGQSLDVQHLQWRHSMANTCLPI